MIVRFAMLCDGCRRRSPEYTHWPECRQCGRDICFNCGEDVEDDSEGHVTCRCVNCRKETLDDA